jgi:hypothetical protein
MLFVAPLNIHHSLIVRARATEHGDCFTCRNHDGNSIVADDVLDSEGLREKMMSNPFFRSLLDSMLARLHSSISGRSGRVTL